LRHIFNLSLHRSGTQSAHDLFRRAGLRSIHWIANAGGVDYQALIEGHEADLDFVARAITPALADYDEVSDAPIPALYRQLARQEPNALFFALYRSPESWIGSVRRHIGARAFVPFERIMYWSYFEHRPQSISELSDEQLHEYHAWHHQSLRAFFAGADNFLLLPLDARGIGAALCDFSGLPRLPFRQFDYALGHDHGLAPESVAARVTE